MYEVLRRRSLFQIQITSKKFNAIWREFPRNPNPIGFAACYRRGATLILGLLSVALANLVASPNSSIDANKKFAYGANTGWINFRPTDPCGVQVAGYFLSGDAYSANFGWINFGDGSPVDGIRYGNGDAADFGVNHDGAGNLSGLAYAANVGWINFSWAAVTDPNRPRIDLVTGDFSGYAYSANTGWINLGSGNLTTATIVCIDADGDGIADPWEQSWFGSLATANAESDQDHDGLRDYSEFVVGLDPTSSAEFEILTSMVINSANQVSATIRTSPSRLYRIQTSGDLLSWSDSGLGIFAPDPGSATTKTFPRPAGKRLFVRAIAIKPLAP